MNKWVLSTVLSCVVGVSETMGTWECQAQGQNVQPGVRHRIREKRAAEENAGPTVAINDTNTAIVLRAPGAELEERSETPTGRGISIGQQGSGTAIGPQSNQPAIGPQTNQPAIGQQGTLPPISITKSPAIGPQAKQPAIGQQGVGTAIGPQSMQPAIGPQGSGTAIGPQSSQPAIGRQGFGTAIGPAPTRGAINTQIAPQGPTGTATGK
jgi:hypothetical protein